MPKTKRVNKSKEQIKAEMKQLAQINHDRALAKLIFSFLGTQKSIYDAQTVLAALAGFIKADVDKQASEILVKDLSIKLEKEKDSEIKTAMLNLLGLLEIEKARDCASLLERFGNTLARYGANEFLKGPISSVKIEDIIA